MCIKSEFIERMRYRNLRFNKVYFIEEYAYVSGHSGCISLGLRIILVLQMIKPHTLYFNYGRLLFEFKHEPLSVIIKKTFMDNLNDFFKKYII